MLATYGVDEQGRPYVHMRVYKQDRIFGEMIATGGEVRLHCRECLRWHKVTIGRQQRLELKEETQPTSDVVKF